jgi:hypothetical protein
MKKNRYQFCWNEYPTTQRRRTAYKFVTACFEGRVPQNHRSPGIDRLLMPISKVFL